MSETILRPQMRRKAHRSGAGHDCVFGEPVVKHYELHGQNVTLFLANCECDHVHAEEPGTRNGLCVDLQAIPDQDGNMPEEKDKANAVAEAIAEWLERTVVPDIRRRQKKLN